MEPMLLEDYKHGHMPQTLKNLMDFYQENNLSPDKNDIIVGLLHILMLESGFIHKDCEEKVDDYDFNYQRLLRLSKNLPTNWKRTNSYQMDFILTCTPDLLCTIISIPISDDLLINCTVKDIGSYSLLIDPLMYYISSKIKLGKCMFQNLDHLSRNFKNSIAYPAKIAIGEFSGGISACIKSLPYELLVKIMSYLTISEVLTFARTCRSVCVAAQDSTLWVKLLDRDYRKRNIIKTADELKFLYRIKYARELAKISHFGPSQ